MDQTTQAPEIITQLPEQFMREFEAELTGRIPAEKVKVHLKQEQAARVSRIAGSVAIEGVGQKIASIDPRLYFRMLQDHRDHEGWLHDFLADNPELCCPGYKPKQNGLRHGHTYLNGQPV